MTVITIRNVPPELNERLKERARERGQSLQQYLLRELATMADRVSLETQLRDVVDRLSDLTISAQEVQAAVNEARLDRERQTGRIVREEVQRSQSASRR